MRRFAFLAAATRISAFEFHPEVAYQLRGEHLVITAVAEHYAMEMFSSFATNKTLLPVENWRGLLRDVIDWIARKAGFTFELRSASGDGRSCYRDAGGGKGPPEIYATDYICAQEDVFDFHGTHVDYLDFHEVPTIHGARKNRSMDGHTMTDVYLGIFYITPFRLALSLMTVPIISDVGLTIVLRKEELSGWDQAAFIFDPFTKGMWGLSAMTLMLVSLVIWLIDHAGTVKPKMRLAEAIPEIYGQHLASRQRGYFKTARFRAEWPSYAVRAVHTQVGGPSMYEPRVATASLLNITFAVYAMVWITVYGAQLTANLTLKQLVSPVDSIDKLLAAQKKGAMGSACIQHGTATVKFLHKSFPALETNEDFKRIEDMISALDAGRCEVLILDALTADSVASDCSRKLSTVGQPLRFGPQDLAIGVRPDMPGVQATLSYWIQLLRECSNSAQASACYHGLNMEELVQFWYPSPANCRGHKTGTNAIDSISFMYVFIFCWTAAGFGLLWELGTLRCFDRLLALTRGHRLFDALKAYQFDGVESASGLLIARKLKRSFRATDPCRRPSFSRSPVRDHPCGQSRPASCSRRTSATAPRGSGTSPSCAASAASTSGMPSRRRQIR